MENADMENADMENTVMENADMKNAVAGVYLGHTILSLKCIMSRYTDLDQKKRGDLPSYMSIRVHTHLI
jgi:uncharacterized protein YjbI with pentapeptide repeats